MKYLYPYECEKLNLSNKDELQAAIDGNRREGRKTNYAAAPFQAGHHSSVSSGGPHEMMLHAGHGALGGMPHMLNPMNPFANLNGGGALRASPPLAGNGPHQPHLAQQGFAFAQQFPGIGE